jgi:hypothetical protein
VAALIKEQLGIDPEITEGGRGEFTVWVGDTVVSRKDTHGFPADDEAVSAVRRALAG